MNDTQLKDITNKITTILPRVTEPYVHRVLENLRDECKSKLTFTKYNFYGNILPMPLDIINDPNKKLQYIRKLLKEQPELFTQKRICVMCKNQYHPSKFGVSKIYKDVYLRSYCYDYVKNNGHRRKILNGR